jgi:hypothetical protein
MSLSTSDKLWTFVLVPTLIAATVVNPSWWNVAAWYAGVSVRYLPKKLTGGADA